MADRDRFAAALRRFGETGGEEEPVYGFYPHLNPKVEGKPNTAGTDEAKGRLLEAMLSVAPGSGEAMSARDAWNASGKAGDALLSGNYGEAASQYGNMATAALGAIPGVGAVARGTQRGAAWMDRNLPAGFNRLVDAMTPKDPKNTAFIFAGPTAKTADHAALGQAKEMAEAGASRDDIWNSTGWFRGNDGKWRFEIDDSQSRLAPDVSARLRQTDEGLSAYKGPLHEGIEHPQFAAAYPEAGLLNLRKGPGGGVFDDSTGNITAAGRRPEQALGVTLHEAQHGVQHREGFAQGGNPIAIMAGGVTSPEIEAAQAASRKLKPGTPEHSASLARLMRLEEAEARRRYRALAGEVEARNVESRMNMTPAERRVTPPWLTQDVSDDQQIFGRK